MKKIIIANFKLNGNKKFIKKYILKINKEINNDKYEISIAPPIPYLYMTEQLIKKNKKINLTSQNIDINKIGSYTGNISGKMLKDIKVKYVIIGHSERKIYHLENNDLIFKKILITKETKLIPIICIGENINEYNKNIGINTCIKQIKFFINEKNINLFNKSILAYEPIWAIGTGKNANTKYIKNMNKNIRNYLNTLDKKITNTIRIVYGGSVNINNFKEIIKINNVDGLLIGKESLNIDNFIKIINFNNNQK